MAIQHPRKGDRELYLGDNLCLGRSFVSVKGHGVTIGQNGLLKNIAAKLINGYPTSKKRRIIFR